MTNDHLVILALLIAGVPYAWLLAKVMAIAFFDEKRRYHRAFMREFDQQ